MNFNIIKIAALSLVLSSLSPSARAGQPKLVVAVVIDQMRYDYLEKYHDQFTTNGLRLLTDRGAFLTFAHYNYSQTTTGPGHSTFLSGSTPQNHGIIGNDWLDKKSGKEVYCVDDPSVEGVGATPGRARMSPKNFIGGTFADELRIRFHSKVVGISMKDRGAILTAGKKPLGAFWFYTRNGNFVTSTYYMAQLPAWVEEFNNRKRPQQVVGQTWERLLSETNYSFLDSVNSQPIPTDEKNRPFSHKVAAARDGSFDNIIPTPFGNDILEEFAEAAIEGEKLGLGPQPDLLTVSFSSGDYVGHRYGPYSQEMHDIVLRLDQQLNRFFNYLDQKIGLGNVIITLSADHAVGPTPEFAKSQGLEGQRVDEFAVITNLNARLVEEYGPGKYFLSSKSFSGNVYLNHALLSEKKINLHELSLSIRDAVLATGKFQACYTREQLLEGRAPGPVGQLVLNGYNPERSGDFVFVQKPYSIPGTGSSGTTHGSPYAYDTHVPVLFFGEAFKPGRYPDEFYITDVVPTLCAALGMTEPAGSSGKPFKAALTGQ